MLWKVWKQVITSPSLVFLNLFIRDMILPATQQNLLFPQSSDSKYCHRTFFIKKLLNICHVICSRIVSSFVVPSRLLGAPIVLNQMRCAWNCEVCLNILNSMLASKTICSRFSKKASAFMLIDSHLLQKSFVFKIRKILREKKKWCL